MKLIQIFSSLSLYFLFFSANAINARLDSLKSNLPLKNDTNKVIHYLYMLDICNYEDTKTKAYYTSKALELSEKLEYAFGRAKSYENMALNAELDKNMVQALEYNFRALDIYNKTNISYQSVNVLVKIATIFDYYSDTKTANSYLKYAEKTLYRHPKPEKIKGAIVFLIGMQIKLNMIAESKQIIDQYKRIFDLKSKKYIAVNAAFYNHVCEYYMAKKDFKNSLYIGRLVAYYIIKHDYQNSSTNLLILNSLGNTFKLASQFDSSSFYLNKCLKYSIANHFIFWQALANRDLALLYQAQNKISDALIYASQYEKITSTNYYNFDTKKAELMLAELYMEKNEYFTAYHFMKKYVHTADSIMKVESSYIINNLIYKHGLEEAERMNELLITENKKKDLIIRDKQVLQFGLILGTFIIFIFAIFVIFLFVQYRINNNLLKSKSEEIIGKNEILESQNILLEKLNDDKNGIIGVVSHDLKAPLNRIEGLLNLVLTDTKFEEQSIYISIAQKELVEAKEMINKILDSELKNTDENKLIIEKLNVVQFLNEIVDNYQIVASHKLIKIQKKYSIDALEIQTDKNHLTRIIDNLLSNAIKFSKNNRNVTVNLIDNLQEIAIIITDEGPGFTEEDKKNIFKKYHKLSAQPTRGENSTGLGLHIVDKLTHELQGKIELRSTASAGATFTLTFQKNI